MSAGGPATIDELTFTDLADVAEIHIEAFGDSVLSLMGAEIVAAYYAWRLQETPDALLMGAREPNGRLIGIVLSGTFARSIEGFLLSHLAAAAAAVVKHPGRFVNLGVVARGWSVLRTRITNVRRTNTAVGSAPEHPSYRGMSLAVRQGGMGAGAAVSLMRTMERRVRESGVTEMGTTVRRANTDALALFTRLGWVPYGETASHVSLKRTLVKAADPA